MATYQLLIMISMLLPYMNQAMEDNEKKNSIEIIQQQEKKRDFNEECNRALLDKLKKRVSKKKQVNSDGQEIELPYSSSQDYLQNPSGFEGVMCGVLFISTIVLIVCGGSF